MTSKLTDEHKRKLRDAITRKLVKAKAKVDECKIDNYIDRLESIPGYPKEFRLPNKETFSQLAYLKALKPSPSSLNLLTEPVRTNYLKAIEEESKRNNWPLDEKSILSLAESRLHVANDKTEKIRRQRIKKGITTEKEIKKRNSKSGRHPDEMRELLLFHMIAGIENFGLMPTVATFSGRSLNNELGIVDIISSAHNISIDEQTLKRAIKKHKKQRKEINERKPIKHAGQKIKIQEHSVGKSCEINLWIDYSNIPDQD